MNFESINTIESAVFPASGQPELLITLVHQVSALGSTILAAIILIGLWQLHERKLAGELFAALAGTKILIRSIKPVIARSRPQESLIQTYTYSFPSEHAATAFLLASVLGKKYPNLRVFLYTLAVLVSLSRVFLRVHYPTDVVAGALIGLAAGYFVNNFETLKQRFGDLKSRF